MKILKPGKFEQRKFVCPKCGCIFVARETEVNTDIDLYVCPQDGCRYYAIGWEDGEPYEEPTQDDVVKLLYGMISRECMANPDIAFQIAKSLLLGGRFES